MPVTDIARVSMVFAFHGFQEAVYNQGLSNNPISIHDTQLKCDS